MVHRNVIILNTLELSIVQQTSMDNNITDYQSKSTCKCLMNYALFGPFPVTIIHVCVCVCGGGGGGGTCVCEDSH